MKRVFVGTAVVLVLLATGCSEDKTPLTPGSPDDTAFQALQFGFGDIEEATMGMTAMSFEMIGGILAQGAGQAAPAFQGVVYETYYVEETDFWVAHVVVDDEMGTVLTVSDSVQFLQGGMPVQYPAPDKLDLVRSFARFNLEGQDGTFSGHQNVTAVPEVLETQTLVTLNGNGGLEGSFQGEQTDEFGVTSCAVDASLAITFDDLVVPAEEGQSGCPLSGRVNYRGQLAVECTGAHELSHSAGWTIDVRFMEGTTLSVRATSGGNYWEWTGPCE